MFTKKFVCIVLTALRTRFCYKLIYMYVLRWRMSEITDFYKITIGSFKFMQHSIFWANIFVDIVLTDLLETLCQ